MNLNPITIEQTNEDYAFYQSSQQVNSTNNLPDDFLLKIPVNQSERNEKYAKPNHHWKHLLNTNPTKNNLTNEDLEQVRRLSEELNEEKLNNLEDPSHE